MGAGYATLGVLCEMESTASTRPIFLTAQWRNLAMLNYEIAPEVLALYVPRGCELDAWNGKSFISIVGFQFLSTRVYGIPIPGHRNFPEVNLRFYVRRRAADEWRRGVVFVKELVPRRAIAWVARRLYGERYQALPMRQTVALPEAAVPGSVAYEWKRAGIWEGLTAQFAGNPQIPADDSEEAFIAEHYWGYCRLPNGETLEYQVEHPRWRVWNLAQAALNCDVTALYGPDFGPALSRPPTSAFVAEGSEVIVRRAVNLHTSSAQRQNA